MYFGADDSILVSTEDDRILVFNKDGYVVHASQMDIVERSFAQMAGSVSAQCPPCMSTPNQIVIQSTTTQEYGKFFVLQNPKKTLTLVQSDAQRSFTEIVGSINAVAIKERLKRQFEINDLIESLNL